MQDTDAITGWHAHVYFSESHIGHAQQVCERARDLFGIRMGRLHPAPVGPHPCGSCQLTVPAEMFAQVIPWLALNRDGLTVFAHAETGDAWTDHTEHVIWLGESQALRLDVLRRALNKD